MIRTTLLAATLLAAASFQPAAAATTYKYKTITDGKGMNTSLHDINDSNVAVGGVFAAGATIRPCFILKGKTKTPLSDPKAVNGTECWGISSNGIIVGDYFDANSISTGYIYSKGAFTDITPPKATATVVYGVNASGVVIGYYLNKAGALIGFLYDGTKYTDIKIKGGSGSQGWGINDSGDYTVLSILSNGNTNSYLVRNGKMTQILFPNTIAVAAHHLTNQGVVVGNVEVTSGIYRAGIFDSVNNTYVVTSDPKGTLTIGDGINEKGTIVGRYEDSNSNSFGYVAKSK